MRGRLWLVGSSWARAQQGCKDDDKKNRFMKMPGIE